MLAPVARQAAGAAAAGAPAVGAASHRAAACRLLRSQSMQRRAVTQPPAPHSAAWLPGPDTRLLAVVQEPARPGALRRRAERPHRDAACAAQRRSSVWTWSPRPACAAATRSRRSRRSCASRRPPSRPRRRPRLARRRGRLASGAARPPQPPVVRRCLLAGHVRAHACNDTAAFCSGHLLASQSGKAAHADGLIWPVRDGVAARSEWAAQTIGSGGASEGLIASALCPMHGPVVERSMSELLRQYRHAPMRSCASSPTGCSGCTGLRARMFRQPEVAGWHSARRSCSAAAKLTSAPPRRFLRMPDVSERAECLSPHRLALWE